MKISTNFGDDKLVYVFVIISSNAPCFVFRVVLYKERNALMTYLARSKRSNDKPKTAVATIRMRKVKDSMQGIKAVLGERRAAFKILQARIEPPVE